MTDALTHDAFLGGQVHLWQPRNGYRAGVDPVLLAAAVPAKPGQRVLELGCGAGAALLCLHTRAPDLDLTGVELQPDYAALAKRNGKEAGANMQVVTADLRQLPGSVRQAQFDHVIMNPPYYERGAGSQAADAGRDIALRGETPLGDWLDQGIKRVGAKGYLTLIQRIDRLPEVISVLQARLGSIVLRPIAPRHKAPANLFIIQARQDGRAPFRLLAPHIMHVGDQHEGDAESYTPLTKSILRNAAALPMSD